MQFSRLASIVVDVTFVLAPAAVLNILRIGVMHSTISTASGATPIAWKTELKHTMPAAGTDGFRTPC